MSAFLLTQKSRCGIPCGDTMLLVLVSVSYARSSTGRVADSKSVGWGFDSLRAWLNTFSSLGESNHATAEAVADNRVIPSERGFTISRFSGTPTAQAGGFDRFPTPPPHHSGAESRARVASTVAVKMVSIERRVHRSVAQLRVDRRSTHH